MGIWIQLRRLVFPFALCASAVAVGASYEAISEKQLEEKLKQHCTLVVPWASWCALCLEELPLLLPALKSRTGIHPVVLDFSRPYVQESFSRKFLDQLQLSYPTYRIPMKTDESRYRRVLDPTWKGALPTAFLFTCKSNACGLAKRWDSKLSVAQLDEVAALCASELEKSAKTKP